MLAITNESIITKMMHELENAKAKKAQNDAVREHIRAVRSLCDLILEEDSEPSIGQSKNNHVNQEQELKAMMGSLNLPSSSSKQIDNQTHTDHGEANGKSIFDF